ncbi:hypothetical protein [Thermobacillus sp.]|uniref:Uncharacterized protein n=2 Tax=Thermobacillus TaxID=76632 RepID=L0EAA2_THECK|nr:hypothetical protein [Thermobacillus sp.]AGA57208.1 hypothetical protein Theco_1029 [Thermobacillus composti KWC4]
MTEFGELVRTLVDANAQVLLTSDLETAQPFIENLGGSFPAQYEATAGILDSDANAAALKAYLSVVPEAALLNNPYLMSDGLPALGVAWASRHYKVDGSAFRVVN